jgi:endonuclease/exonuclease/phosphatase (EEP) superfamily protein YafD
MVLVSWVAIAVRGFWDAHPVCELATHASWHILLGLSVVVIVDGWMRWVDWRRSRSTSGTPAKPRRLGGVLMVTAWLLFLGITQPWLALPLRSRTPSPGSLTVFAWNLLIANQNVEEMLRTIGSIDPDVIVLTEVGPWHESGLRSLEQSYPHALWLPQRNTRGMAVLSRVPYTQFGRHTMGEAHTLAIEARLPSQGDYPEMSILGIHTSSPNLEGRFRIRDSELLDVAEWAKGSPRAAMVIGDMNISPWSPPFGAMLRSSGLRDSRDYRGLFPSWPSGLGFFGIPIDHALVSPELEVVDRRVGWPSSDSDHGWIAVTVRSRVRP